MVTFSESLDDATGTLGQRCLIISVVPVGKHTAVRCSWPRAEAPNLSHLQWRGDSSEGTPSWRLLGPPQGQLGRGNDAPIWE